MAVKETEDIRVIKSKRALKKALFRLMTQEPFEKINVCQICEAAKINRMTFYNHYDDKYALFSDAICDIREEIRKKFEIELKNKHTIDEKMFLLFELTVETSERYHSIIKSLSNSQEYYSLFHIVENIFITPIEEFFYFTTNGDTELAKLEATYAIGGISASISYYIKNIDSLNRDKFMTFAKKQMKAVLI